MNIYFDHAAATPMDPQVCLAKRPYCDEFYGNPSSVHQFGQKGRVAIDKARATVAKHLNCKEKEIIFTGSGTEANNTAIFGIAEAYKEKGKHIITSAAEHHATLHPIEYLEKNRGFKVTYLPVDKNGLVKAKDVEKAITKDTILVSIIYANNETGAINPIAKIGKITKEQKIAFHVDACQATPYLDLNVENLGVDLMTINGSKMYGPKGSGVLYLSRLFQIVPLIMGGGQESRMRAGTENVAGIVGLAKALSICRAHRDKDTQWVKFLRDRLWKGIEKNISDITLNGPEITFDSDDLHKRLPNNLNLIFQGITGESLLYRLDMVGIAASAGSACTAGNLEPSHVILALGHDKQTAEGAIRFTLGKDNTEKEVDYCIEQLIQIVKELREISPFYSK